VYVLLIVASPEVTTTVIVVVPDGVEMEPLAVPDVTVTPLTLIVDVLSGAVGVIVMVLVECPVKVYARVVELNEGDRAPLPENVRLDKPPAMYGSTFASLKTKISP
jgi:hypothetical protein